MFPRYLAIALVGSTLVSSAAMAQEASKQEASKQEASRQDSWRSSGEWRGSKLVGLNVYNQGNEKIGDISDIILDKSGRVSKVVLGVGGFLGIGEHYVAVSFDKLKWSDLPVGNASASAPATNVDSNARTAADEGVRSSTTTGAATSGNSLRSAKTNWYPDHAVLNATKDQLKTMPQFKY